MSSRTRTALLAMAVSLLGWTQAASEEVCTDATDNDADGLIDCADVDCDRDPACDGPHEICSNAVDDDGDGRIDCNDTDCIDSRFCFEQFPEICGDRLDNDGDGRIDCADSDCCAAPDCLAAGCTPFKRGDVDGDGRRTISDAVLILIALFGGGAPLPCSDAADLDDSDSVEIADPIYLLAYVFQGGPQPPPPFLECDKDPTQGSMDCNRGFRCV